MTADTIHQEFTLTGQNAWTALCAFIKANAKPYLEAGRPLRVIVVDEEADRLDEQIAYYFSALVDSAAAQVWVPTDKGRRQYSKVVWHEYFCEKFLPPKEIELPTGQTILKRASIARGKIGVRAMAKFTKEVEAFIVVEHGVRIPERRQG